jgi:prepilin signal peptidase PulO-like enzyme (type II secretory pathway)
MASYQLYIWLAQLVPLAFVFAFGACIGSLTNVLVYRMPRGLDVVSPPSRCPKCQTRLTWRENIPIFGWLLLGGRCRFCKAKISPEYPIVETAVAFLFALFFFLYYLVPTRGSVWLGIDWGAIKPEWAGNGIDSLAETWPTFLILLTLLGSLVAMTLIDAKTFTIPLVLTWVPALVALVVHPLHALWIQSHAGHLRYGLPGWAWTIATPDADGWWAIGVSIGGVLGLLAANVLAHYGKLRRSFADYEEWEKSVTGAATADAPPAAPDVPITIGLAASPAPSAALPSAGPFSAAAPQPAPAAPPSADRALIDQITIDPALLAIDPAPAIIAPLHSPSQAPAPSPVQAPPPPSLPTDLWIQYPHARREMIKELVFLGPCIGLACAGGLLAHWLAGPWYFTNLNFNYIPSHFAPLWLLALSGVFLGYLIGGGLVWLVRIAGSLAFGKEAMGLGDVHMMAAVGACLGWVHPTLAFFGAAFVGLLWAIISSISGGRLRRAMPYGPFLAIATMLVILAKHQISLGLSQMFGYPITFP